MSQCEPFGAEGPAGVADALSKVDCLANDATSVSFGRLFGALEAKRISTQVSITTEDGTLGEKGRVTDVLPGMLQRSGSDVVYACGPMPMLRAVHEIATLHGAHSQVAVEEAMACGVGICMTCVLPVVGDDGETRMLRSCVDGPVLRGDRIRWDELGTIPADVVGAPVEVTLVEGRR
jgi:dihydroorotate dehydrogenase electron transfer subunit